MSSLDWRGWLKRFFRPFRSVEISISEGIVTEDGKKRKMTAQERKEYHGMMEDFQKDMDKLAETWERLIK